MSNIRNIGDTFDMLIKDSEVKKALTDATAAVLEVSSHRICVLEGKERN